MTQPDQSTMWREGYDAGRESRNQEVALLRASLGSAITLARLPELLSRVERDAELRRLELLHSLALDEEQGE